MAPGASRSVTIRIPGNRSAAIATNRSNGPNTTRMCGRSASICPIASASFVAPGVSSHSAETAARFSAMQRPGVARHAHDLQRPAHGYSQSFRLNTKYSAVDATTIIPSASGYPTVQSSSGMSRKFMP